MHDEISAQLPLGLFSETAKTRLPLAISLALEAKEIDLQENSGIIEALGRCFVMCQAGLPLASNGPVQIKTWIECDHRYVSKIQALRQGKPGNIYGQAVLAADVPGFAGSVGSVVAFSLESGETLPQLRRIDDQRINDLSNLEKDALAGLYRKTWGNTKDLIEADVDLRAATEAAWILRNGEASYSKDVQPPPSVAGMTPAALLVWPPRDTHYPVSLATVGAAEAAREKNPAEIMTTVRNPTPEFITNFSEFCYLTRMTTTVLKHGSLISEKTALPGSQDMHAWVLVKPWWEDDDWSQIAVGAQPVDLLYAVFVKKSEQEYAQRRGIKELIRALETSDLDLFDLHRESCLLV